MLNKVNSMQRAMNEVYIVVVTSKQVLAQDNSVMTKDGERFIVIECEEGWVEATSTRFDKNNIPKGALTFKTKHEAHEFAHRWQGHPWWCIPSGQYAVIKVRRKYRQVLSGYDMAEELDEVQGIDLN